jgi:hypothetical protein
MLDLVTGLLPAREALPSGKILNLWFGLREVI